MARLKIDLLFGQGGTPVARAVKQANVIIPVIVPAMGDPVSDGVVASLAHPRTNITGSTFLGPALVPKRIELLKEAIPGISRVAALWHPGAYGDRTRRDMLRETEVAAQKLGVQLQLLEAGGANDFDKAFSAMIRERARALLVLPSPMFYGEHKHIVDFAIRNRLPAIFAFGEDADTGALMSYGANLADLFAAALLKWTRFSRAPNLAICHRAADQVRAGDQPQDRKGPRAHNPPVGSGAGGSRDRVVDRRAFVSTVAVGLLAAPLAAEAQPVGKGYRIGVLATFPPPSSPLGMPS